MTTRRTYQHTVVSRFRRLPAASAKCLSTFNERRSLVAVPSRPDFRSCHPLAATLVPAAFRRARAANPNAVFCVLGT
jgi:hypothetical protein